MEYSFDTMAGFNKAYNALRKDIMEALNTTGKVRLNGAIVLMHKFEGGENFLRITSSKTDMISHIKMYEGRNAEYKLMASKGLVIRNG